jgi:hypothetical protein
MKCRGETLTEPPAHASTAALTSPGRAKDSPLIGQSFNVLEIPRLQFFRLPSILHLPSTIFPPTSLVSPNLELELEPGTHSNLFLTTSYLITQHASPVRSIQRWPRARLARSRPSLGSRSRSSAAPPGYHHGCSPSAGRCSSCSSYGRCSSGPWSVWPDG